MGACRMEQTKSSTAVRPLKILYKAQNLLHHVNSKYEQAASNTTEKNKFFLRLVLCML